jgi:predicted nucleotidyltransferase
MANRHSKNAEEKGKIAPIILSHLSDVKIIILFGSRATDNFNATSDFDIAVLRQEPMNAEVALALKLDLSANLRQDVDLIDLRSADTVTKFHVVSQGEVLWEESAPATGAFETLVYSQYASLNTERAGILEDIAKRGTIYGR